MSDGPNTTTSTDVRRQAMKTTPWLAAMLLMTASAQAALPGDDAEGKRLHDANCTGCHDTGVYARKDRIVQSLEELKQQFDDCSHMAKKEFSPAEKQDIVKYLNDRFYRFR
jgi:cytochrome c2